MTFKEFNMQSENSNVLEDLGLEQLQPTLVTDFEQHGIKSAGKSAGSPDVFDKDLELIYRGELIDRKADDNDRILRKQEVEKEKEGLESKISDLTEQLDELTEVTIPDMERKEEEVLREIDELKVELEEERVSSDFHIGRFVMYFIITLFLGLFIFVFYGSALYQAFFNDAFDLLRGENVDIGMLLTSIFNPEAFLNPGPAGWFTRLGTAFIFALGIIPHRFIHSRMKGRYVFATIAMLLPLLIDFGIAYKIDETIQLAMEVIGLEPDPNFWLHVNFWLVIAFGYLAYMAWGILLEATYAELDKRNPEKVARQHMKNMHRRLEKARAALLKLRTKEINLTSKIDRLNAGIERKDRSLKLVTYSVSDMIHNIEAYAKGFYNYLELTHSKSKLVECKERYNAFMREKFDPVNKPALN